MSDDLEFKGPYAELYEDCHWEMMAARERGPVQIVLTGDLLDLCGILGSMQLALRRPSLRDLPSTKLFKAWAKEIESKIAECGPSCKKLAAMGWWSQFDTTPS